MKKRITRPRSLLLVAVLAVVAAVCTVSTANAASSARAAPHEPAVSTAPCNFTQSLQTCESADPSVAYYDTAHNASHCTFVFDITWGDNSGTTKKTITHPTNGHHLVATHLYAAGVYAITVKPRTTSGTCTATSSVHTFTLVSSTSAYNCSCVTYVRDTLASQGITLKGGPSTASGYTEKWMSKHGWRRVVPPNNGTIPAGGKPMVMVWDAKKKGAFGDGHMAIVVTDWSGTYLGAIGKSPWYNYQTKQWNISVLQDDWAADPSTCTPAQHFFTGTSWGNLDGVNFYVPD
jgi:hypothetical protein